MAEQSTGERTEKPTAKRLGDARAEGRIPDSQELPHAFMVGTILLVLSLAGAGLFGWFKGILERGLRAQATSVNGTNAIESLLYWQSVEVLIKLIPFMIGALAASVAGSLLVSGWGFSTKALRWDLSRLNPITGFKNLFSMKMVVNVLISMAKLTVIAIVIWVYLRDRMQEMMDLRWATPLASAMVMAELVFGLLLRFAICLLVIAGIDVAYQKWNYMRELRMTKQEVKDEMKNQEMPAEARAKIRTKQMAMSRQRMMKKVPKADVVITNPTHYAVALQYDSDTMMAPKVVAKGADLLCERIKQIAAEHNIPIVRRPELARAIYSTVELDEYIPEALYVAVAEVLAMIFRLRSRRQRAEATINVAK
ncbi:MAG: flagellar biosynthesis protein FlhB [Planctomycetes bacterium]|nr:flagellar biosynthesis protein FlhB [Planctomycetota bacterium]